MAIKKEPDPVMKKTEPLPAIPEQIVNDTNYKWGLPLTSRPLVQRLLATRSKGRRIGVKEMKARPEARNSGFGPGKNDCCGPFRGAGFALLLFALLSRDSIFSVPKANHDASLSVDIPLFKKRAIHYLPSHCVGHEPRRINRGLDVLQCWPTHTTRLN